MYSTSVLWLAILIIGASTASCEEAAYAFWEFGVIKLDQYSLSELNGSEIATFTVTSRDDDTPDRTICPSEKNLSVIKTEITKRVQVGNESGVVVNQAAYLAQKFPGEHSVEQVCSIFEYLKGNWNHTGDPRCEEYYRYASETIELGNMSGLAGAGDCDDFPILMSALIENIGGTTRINLVYDESQGHAYTEVCIGKLNDYDNKVNKTVFWLREKYKTDNICMHVDEDTNFVWLNLDWWADHPGGPFYPSGNHVKFVRIGPDKPIVPLNPPNIPPSAIIGRVALSG